MWAVRPQIRMGNHFSNLMKSLKNPAAWGQLRDCPKVYGNGRKIVYDTYMKFKDQFTITLNSEQHALLNECLSGVASLDLPPSLDDNFDQLWENVIECDHQIIEDNS